MITPFSNTNQTCDLNGHSLATFISYCLPERRNASMSSFSAPHQASFLGDPPMSGSSNGFDSPRKKCNIGIAKSHSGLNAQVYFINSLQRRSIALVEYLIKHII